LDRQGADAFNLFKRLPDGDLAELIEIERKLGPFLKIVMTIHAFAERPTSLARRHGARV